jgi:hypothetical protein
MMVTAHNQVLAGKSINIEPIVNLDPKTHYMNAVERSNESFTAKKTAGKFFNFTLKLLIVFWTIFNYPICSQGLNYLTQVPNL